MKEKTEQAEKARKEKQMKDFEAKKKRGRRANEQA